MREYSGLFSIVAIVLLVSGIAFARAGGGYSYGVSSYSGSSNNEAAGLLVLITVGIIMIAVVSLVSIVSFWKIFEKAGQPGWVSIIPIYNAIVLLKILQKPEWWVILYFIPLASTVIGIIVSIALAESFGKDTGFALGIILLPIVFYPILAFGDSEYSVVG